MTFRNRTLRSATAAAVLASFSWMSGGGNVWAECRAVRRDPVRFLERMIDDPRLAMSREQKEAVRRVVSGLAAEANGEPVRLEAPARGGHFERRAAIEMQGIGTELERLAGDPSARGEKLNRSRQRLEAVHRDVLRSFADTKGRLRAAGFPEVILDRHEVAETSYLENVQAVLRDLDVAVRSKLPEEAEKAIASAAKRLRRSTDERPDEEELDPLNLPFRAADPGGLQPGIGSARMAAASLTAPTAADLAENEDVRITPEVRALASSLGDQPVKIFDWVRNNVEFLPTYGSVQGSQMTLDARRGNAFDTASLLIALLRAAGVPARYVTGTVEVPAAQAMSWLGGAASPAAAQQLLGQGGIPNAGVVAGGTITHIRLDHVWVEAFVDSFPSRGAVHRQGDAWLPMDASFKLHQVTPPSSLLADLPISSVLHPDDHLFDVDESLGKVTNLDDEILDERLVAWAQQIDDAMLAQDLEGSMEELVGGRTIVRETQTVFAGALPYKVLARGSAMSELAAGHRHAVTLKGFASQLDRSAGTAAFSITLSLPALNSRRLGIQFDPATQADADVLQAARSSGASSLPVYLVEVAPVVRLDGVALGSGGAVPMGSRYFLDVVMQGPDGPQTVPYQVIAGDEIVLGITGNGITREVVEKRFAANPVDNAPEYLQLVQLHYWLECDQFAEVAARGRGVRMQRLPSVGLFSSPLVVSSFFGVPRSGVYQGQSMDVRRSVLAVAGDSRSQVVQFMKQAGLQSSYLEGSVFGQFESMVNPGPALRSISAVRLLAVALYQDIPLYRITPANAASALPLLELDEGTERDISLALSQGMTVFAPERDVQLGNWQGVGYIIQDEATGAGAYMISGGLHGGGLLRCIEELVPTVLLVLALIIGLIIIYKLILLILAALAGLLAPAAATVALAVAVLLLLFRGMGPTDSAPTTA